MTNLPATNRTLSKSSLAIRLTSGFVALIVLVFVTTCAIIQFWAFPKLEKDPSALQSYLSEKLEGQLSIGKIETFWSFLTPCVRATDINFERAGDIAVTVGLESVTVSGSWISLLSFTPVTSLIDARGLTVDVSRVRPAATPPKGASATPRTLLATETDDPVNVVDRAIREIFENPISVHFLNQRHIVVHDSRVSYTDFGLRDPKSVDLFIKTLKTDKYIVAWDMAVDASIVSENIVSPILIDARVKKPFLAHEGRVESYAGVINADFSKIDFAPIARKIALGRWIRQGAGETRVSTTFEAGRITKLSGDIALEDVELHLSRRSLPVELDTLAAHVEQRLDEDALAIEITNLVAQSPLFGVQSIPKIKLSGLWEGDKLRSLGLGIESIDLQCLDFVLDRIPEKEALLKSLSRLNAQGVVKDFNYRSAGKISAPHDFEAKGSFERLSVREGAWVTDAGFASPGAENLTGTFKVTEHQAEIELKSQNAALIFPDIFRREKLDFETLNLATKITFAPELAIEVTRLQAENEGDAIDLHGSWKQADTPLGILSIEGSVVQGHANHVWRYIPLVAGGLATNDWLMHGLRGGLGQNLKVSVYGDLTRFPFEDGMPDEHFLIEGDFTKGAIDYVPTGKMNEAGEVIPGPWPLLTDIDGHIRFSGMSIAITADTAKTFGAILTDLKADIPDYAIDDVPIIISGKTRTDIARMAAYVEASPVSGFIGHVLDGMTGTREADLTLELDIPLLAPEKTRVKGVITLDGNTASIPHAPYMSELYGVLTFTEKGLTAPLIVGNVLDMPVQAQITTRATGEIDIEATTQVANPNAVAFIADNALITRILKRASGTTPAQATVTIHDGIHVRAKSTLEGITFEAPAPFTKKASEMKPLELYIGACEKKEGCVKKTQASIADLFAMDIGFDANEKPISGTVSIGGLSLITPRQGISLAIELDTLDFKVWADPLNDLFEAASVGRSVTPFDIRTIVLNVKRFIADEITAKNVFARATWTGATRKLTGSLTSTTAQGNFTFTASANHVGSLDLAFKKLYLSESNVTDYAKKVERSPESFPQITAKIDDFRLGTYVLGSLGLATEHKTDATSRIWKIRNLELTNPAFKVKASGDWRKTDKVDQTALDFQTDILNLGNAAAVFGKKGVFSGGLGNLTGHVTWTGAPTDFALETIDGTIDLNMRDGAIIDVDVGATRVFGFLSLTRLLRRLALDFRDVSNTLLFESLTCRSELTDGVLKTDSLKLAGPQMGILANGTIDLKRKEQHMLITVLPEVSFSSPTLALGLVNPVLGVGTFLAQLALSSPLSQALSRSYELTGTFTNPELTEKTP